MGCGIIHWNPGFCKEGQGGFVGFRALRASGRGNCVRFCGRPRGPPLRFYKNIFRSLDGRVLDPPLRRTKRLSFLFVGAGPRPARGRGTPQGGFSRPSADSPSAPPLPFSQKVHPLWVGEALGPPADDGPATTCSAKPGAEGKTHRPQFWESQGPGALKKTKETTQI